MALQAGGGLAEVAYDLPRALAALGHKVGVVTPKPRLSQEMEQGLERLDTVLEVPVSWKRHLAEVYRHQEPSGVEVYLIGHEHLFDREGLYGNAYGDYEDNAERFIFYSRACLELARTMDWRVDVFHANDWTTGLVPVYLRTLYAGDPCLKDAASLMTVHNLGNQGQFWHYDMPLTGLGWEYFVPEALEFYGQINFLKGGLVFADMISTVSHTYAQEILTPELGRGMEGVLMARRDRLAAVVNGIDYQVWNPADDYRLAANYDRHDPSPKARCRQELMGHYGLEDGGGRPLVAVVGRLEDRKGLDLITAGMERFSSGAQPGGHGLRRGPLPCGFGRAGRASSRPFGVDHRLRHRPGPPHHGRGGHAPGAQPLRTLRHPSDAGPALRRGAGGARHRGLADTVVDQRPGVEGTGFKFEPFTMEAMLQTLDRAKQAYDRPQEWRGLMQRAMAQDFSWQAVAPRYEEIYRKALELAGQRQRA